ncbi:MAG: hypothetical protein ACOYOQ_15585 [Microthrixaceae bacterium]
MSANLTAAGGSNVRVDVTRAPGIFGIGKFWKGTITGRLVAPTGGPARRFLAVGITGDNVIKPVPGVCGAVTVDIRALDITGFPWPTKRLTLTIAPANGATTASVAGSFSGVVLTPSAATGTLSVR